MKTESTKELLLKKTQTKKMLDVKNMINQTENLSTESI